MIARAIATLTLGLTVPLAAQWLNHPTPGIPRTAGGKPNLAAPAPRTPDGKPDLSGLWNKISPKYSRNIAADLKPGEVQPWAEALVQQRKEDLGKDYMNVLCVPLGPGYTTDADSTGAEMMKIIQTPGLILILNPDLTYRQIFMDGRALETAPNPSWMGYSVGHWDGDTLVVESFGFNDRTWLDHDGHPHTEALRTTERYRRRDFGNLDLEVTLSDPARVRPALDRLGPRGIGRRHRDDRMGLQREGQRAGALGRQGVRRKEIRGEGRPRDSGEVRGHLRGAAAAVEAGRRGSSRSRSRAARCSPTWTDGEDCR